MVVTLFIMGRSGSGKSTSACYLSKLAQEHGWDVKIFDDHDILYNMYLQERANGKYVQFQPSEYGGFKVVDVTVYDIALVCLKQKIQSFCPLTDKTLIIIEFARDDYEKALKFFGRDFLQKAECIFLATDLDTCSRRIHYRALHPIAKDDFYIDEKVFLSHFYYQYMPTSIEDKAVHIICNQGLQDKQDGREKLRAELRRRISSLLKESPVEATVQIESESLAVATA